MRDAERGHEVSGIPATLWADLRMRAALARRDITTVYVWPMTPTL